MVVVKAMFHLFKADCMLRIMFGISRIQGRFLHCSLWVCFRKVGESCQGPDQKLPSD